MMPSPTPSVGDFVAVTFDRVNGMDTEHKGQVTEVDTEPESLGAEVFFELTDLPNTSSMVHVYAGEYEGERFATVSRTSEFTASCTIGENAEWEIFG